MSNPRDWFRRQSPASVTVFSSDADDPISASPVLELEHPLDREEREVSSAMGRTRTRSSPIRPSAKVLNLNGAALTPPPAEPAGPAWSLVPVSGKGAEPGVASAILREAFTPTRPKQKSRFFAGRIRQMRRIISAIEEERAHVVLYGERGSGKTSLANVVAAKAQDAGYFVVRRACSSELSFDDIFRGFLRGIPGAFLENGIAAQARADLASFADILPPGELRIADLLAAFARLHDKHVILVVDEYDRVAAADIKGKLAELMKNLSDAGLPVTLLLIGVAEDVYELLGQHPSLRRTLVTIPLPLMSRAELADILAAGEARSGMNFMPAVREAIIDLSVGLPYHAQLLGLFAARSAQTRRSGIIEAEDLAYAEERAVEEADTRIKEAYALAIAAQSGGEDRMGYREILEAAASCASDEFGGFTAAGVAAAAGHDTALGPSFDYCLQKLTEPESGAILTRVFGQDGARYRFANQTARHFVLLKKRRGG